jgi:hypothetical protein
VKQGSQAAPVLLLSLAHLLLVALMLQTQLMTYRG